MIIVCDRGDLSRARSLRERILSGGIPSASAAPVSVPGLLPAAAVITWYDVFGELRRMPCDRVYAAVIGDGFVNTALNAGRFPSEDAAIAYVRDQLPGRLGMKAGGTARFGVYFSPRLFFGDGFAEWRGRTVALSATERTILMYLAACSDGNTPASPEKIARFCLPEDRQSPAGIGNRIAAHICGINRKFAAAAGIRAVCEKRGAGYCKTEFL